MMKKRYHKFTEQLMFAIVMRDAALCKELVERIIPDRKVREIRFSENPIMDALAKSISESTDSESAQPSGWMTAETEKVLIPALLSKSVRFDALFEDENAWFDIEMQVDNEDDLPLRIRYYQASKTITSLESGDDYRDLKPGYVIFICLFDWFEKGEAVYRFQNMEENLHLPLDDKQFTIILNLKCEEEKIPEKLWSFYRYVNHGDAGEDAFTQKIKHLVDRANESAEVQNMITYAGDIAAKEKKLEEMMKQMSQELERKEAKAKQMSQELERKEAKAKQMSEALQQAETDAKQMSEALQQAETDAKQMSQELERKEAKAKQMSEALQQAETDAKQMSQELERKEAKAKQMSEALQQAETDAKQMSEALQQAETDAKQMSEALQQAEEKLASEKLETARKLKAEGIEAKIIAAATGLDLDTVETL